MSEYVHRYRLDTKQYWGSTDRPGDDPECGYTDVEPPQGYNFMTEIPVWHTDHWEIEPLQ